MRDPVTGEVVVAQRLTKSYGTSRGIVELTFSVHAGEVFGFLGPNGAGKSTTIRTLLDFIRPTDGSVSVFGMDPRTDAPAIHARTGYMPGEFGLYERMHARAYLEAFAAFRDGNGRSQIDPLAERLSLDLDRPIHDLSHGNRQKVGMVQAFMHEPELLVLDEPTQGLDPLVQQTFYALIDETRARGGTVFLSSHVLPEVERVCDRVGIIREGRLLTVDDVGDLKAKALRSVVFHFDKPVDASVFAPLPSVVAVEQRGDSVAITVQGELDEVVKEAARHTVVNVETREPSLEEIFLRAYRDGGRAMSALLGVSMRTPASRRDRLGHRPRRRRNDVRRPSIPRSRRAHRQLEGYLQNMPEAFRDPHRHGLHVAGGLPAGGVVRAARADPAPRLCGRGRRAFDRRRGRGSVARSAVVDAADTDTGRA